MNPENKEILDEAFRLKRKGNYASSVEKFQESITRFGEIRSNVGMVALLLRVELNKVEASLPYAIRAVELSPQNEMLSFNLYNCLFDLGKIEEAEGEMKRYFDTGGTLNFYEELLKENKLKREDFC